MSFILDALKKSEIERQRQSMPGLIDVPAAPRRRRLPWWAFLIGALLIVNMVVLTVVLVRNGSHPAMAQAAPPSPSLSPSTSRAQAEAAPAAATGTVARQAAPPAGADHFSPLDNASQYAPEIPVPNEPATAAAAAPVPAGPAHAAPRRADPLLSETESAADNDEVLPSMSELNLSGQQALPELHLDVHVYGTKPSERFVYINMRKYHEGATLQEGPLLEHIRRDGAVLEYHGVRFLLPRQS